MEDAEDRQREAPAAWPMPAGGEWVPPAGPAGPPAPPTARPDATSAWRGDWPPPPDETNPYAAWGTGAPAASPGPSAGWGHPGDPYWPSAAEAGWSYPGEPSGPAVPAGPTPGAAGWSYPGEPSGPGGPAAGAGGWGGYPSDPGGWGAGGWGPGWGGGPSGPGGPAGPAAPGGWASPWTPSGAARPRRSLPNAIIAALLAVAVLVGLGLGHGVWHSSSAGPLPSGSGNPGIGGNGSGGGGLGGLGNGSSGASPNQVAQAVQGALVDINTDLGFSANGSQAAGTGIVLTSDGEVLTNNHVIAGATRISVTDIGNGHTYTGTVTGYDRTHDIAVVQLRGASGLQTAKIGNSGRVSVGDPVIGIGNAGGLGGAPSSATGTITALDQSITATDESDGSSEQLAGLIQVDANIQPGDSGGALVNAQGQVIGVDTAASAGFSFQTSGGQGFAIPINQATTIARAIRDGHASPTIHLGPTAFLGVLVDNTTGSGATLNRVVSSGPAAKAGLTGGDVITSLNGQSVDSAATLTKLMSQYHPGDQVTIGWSDPSGQTHKSVVSLAAGPAQ